MLVFPIFYRNLYILLIKFTFMLEKLKLDKRDIQIIDLVTHNPNISQSDIAHKLKLSQPSINSRLKKLKEKGVLAHNIGIEFNKAKLFMARVDFTATHANSILKNLKRCPYFVNGFIMSGKNNASVFFVSEDLHKIDEIINEQLRTNTQISDINVNVVVSSVNEFIFKPNFERKHKSCSKKNCDVCSC